VEKYERLNEYFSQSHDSPINASQNHQSNIADSPDDPSQINFDNHSPSSFTSQTANGTYAVDNEENMYVLYLRNVCWLLEMLFRS
jgi:hypothetical protein